MIQIIIIIIVMWIFLSLFQLMLIADETAGSKESMFEKYRHLYSFKTLYEETSLNELGIILHLLIQIIFFLPAVAAYFIYWLCHKKEK